MSRHRLLTPIASVLLLVPFSVSASIGPIYPPACNLPPADLECSSQPLARQNCWRDGCVKEENLRPTCCQLAHPQKFIDLVVVSPQYQFLLNYPGVQIRTPSVSLGSHGVNLGFTLDYLSSTNRHYSSDFFASVPYTPSGYQSPVIKFDIQSFVSAVLAAEQDSRVRAWLDKYPVDKEISFSNGRFAYWGQMYRYYLYYSPDSEDGNYTPEYSISVDNPLDLPELKLVLSHPTFSKYIRRGRNLTLSLRRYRASNPWRVAVDTGFFLDRRAEFLVDPDTGQVRLDELTPSNTTHTLLAVSTHLVSALFLTILTYKRFRAAPPGKNAGRQDKAAPA